MSKPDLVRRLQRKFPDLPPSMVAQMSEDVFDTIIDAVASGGRAEIRNFGVFYGSDLARRLLRHPRDGRALEVPARRIPRFRAGAALRKKVNRRQDDR